MGNDGTIDMIVSSVVFCLITIAFWIWVIFFNGSIKLGKMFDEIYSKKYFWRFMYDPMMVKIFATLFLLGGFFTLFLNIKDALLK